MVGAVTGGDGIDWRRVVVGGLLLAVVGCGGGGGKDHSFVLPPGTAIDTTRTGKVLLVVEAGNQCRPDHTCVPAAPGACHTGNGNTRGLAIYRLGASGLLFGAAGASAAVPEQVIATDDNPRRVLPHPTDPTLVFVATLQRIQVFRLDPAGGSRCIAETLADDEVEPNAPDLDPVDLAIDPTVGHGVLYVASRGASRVDAYEIADDGTIPEIPTSCAIGRSDAEYQALALPNEQFVVAGGRSRIDVFGRREGQFPAGTPTPGAATTPTPTPASTPTGSAPAFPTPAPSCINAQVVTEPVSEIGAAIITDLLFVPSDTAPLGQLFVSEEVSRRLFTFPIDASGIVSEDDSSRTKAVAIYQTLLLTRRGGSSLLYVSVFQEGRVDVFRLEDGLLPDKSFSRTAEDPDALPVGLALEEPNGSVVYVGEGGLGRVDGFTIQADGTIDDLPVTSTLPVVDAEGKSVDSFPNDIALIPFP